MVRFPRGVGCEEKAEPGCVVQGLGMREQLHLKAGVAVAPQVSLGTAVESTAHSCRHITQLKHGQRSPAGFLGGNNFHGDSFLPEHRTLTAHYYQSQNCSNGMNYIPKRFC